MDAAPGESVRVGRLFYEDFFAVDDVDVAGGGLGYAAAREVIDAGGACGLDVGFNFVDGAFNAHGSSQDVERNFQVGDSLEINVGFGGCLGVALVGVDELVAKVKHHFGGVRL